MIITICKKRTADKKFPACSFFPVLIYDDQVTIVTGNADRKCFLIGKSVINNIVTANIGCLCRTEKDLRKKYQEVPGASNSTALQA